MKILKILDKLTGINWSGDLIPVEDFKPFEDNSWWIVRWKNHYKLFSEEPDDDGLLADLYDQGYGTEVFPVVISVKRKAVEEQIGEET